MYAALCVLREVSRWRPHLVVGEGQGGLVAMLLGLPLVYEFACRYRGATPPELTAFRGTVPLVQAIIAMDPCIARGFPDFDVLRKALPEMFAIQPRLQPDTCCIPGPFPRPQSFCEMRWERWTRLALLKYMTLWTP